MSEGLTGLVSAIETEARNYQPGPEVERALREKTLVAIIGPLAVGKTSVMDDIEARYAGFARVRGFTTRPQRPDEPDTYRFWPHDRETLEQIHGWLTNGELVQAAVHRQTGYVYGSTPEDYPGDYNLRDVLSSAMDSFRDLPFEHQRELALIAHPDDWRGWLKERIKNAGRDDTAKRTAEAVQSLMWSLEQGEDFPWVVNRAGYLHETADEVVALARGERVHDPINREIGEIALTFIQNHPL